MIWLYLLLGLVTGMLSGVIGIGGGIVIVPLLVWLAGMSQHRAQGTSLAVLLVPAGIFAVIEYYKKGNIDIKVAALLAVGFLIGGYFGGRFAQHIPDYWLRRIFATVLVIVGVRMFFK